MEALRRHWSLAELLNLPTEGVRSLYFPRAALVGVALSLSAAATAALPFPDNGWLTAIRLRLSAGLDPGWAGWIPAIVAVAGQELMFRGLLQRAVGPLRAGLFFVLVCSPLDPLRGAAAAAALALLAQRGGVPLALIARLAWALAPESLSIASPGGQQERQGGEAEAPGAFAREDHLEITPGDGEDARWADHRALRSNIQAASAHNKSVVSAAPTPGRSPRTKAPTLAMGRCRPRAGAE